MKILFISNGSGMGTAKSGGMTRHIEIAKKLLKKGIEVSFLTTIGSYSTYKAEGLKARFILALAHIFSRKEKNNLGRALSYIVSTFSSLLLLNRLPEYDIVYTTSDYFCDIIPAFFLKLSRPDLKWMAMIHHLYRPPFKRKGNFIINSVAFLLQRFSFKLIRSQSACILLYDTLEGKTIQNLFLKHDYAKKIFSVANGVDLELIDSLPMLPKKYDACFAGGLRASKGIFEIIRIWSLVVKQNNQRLLAIAGGGTIKIVEQVKREIIRSDLNKNILLLGPLDQVELIKTMKASKIFVSASQEEGWGIALYEALACGLPVVAYRLPAFTNLKKAIIGIDMFNQIKFANNIRELLTNENLTKKLIESGRDIVKKYSWKQIAETELKIFQSIN